MEIYSIEKFSKAILSMNSISSDYLQGGEDLRDKGKQMSTR